MGIPLQQRYGSARWSGTEAMCAQSKNSITEVTRRKIIDRIPDGAWAGALDEPEFLGRIYDLKRMPSTDSRREFNNASLDIWQHRVRNSDWEDDWIFTDSRFDLLYGPDEQFLKFLAETVHPVVRPDQDRAHAMVAEYNASLAVDGWEIHPVKEISGRPVYSYRRLADSAQPHLAEAKRLAARMSGAYIAQQVSRLEAAAEKDTDLAIGTAKEFLETVCKTILSERGVAVTKNEDLPALVRATVKSVTVVPPSISNAPQAEKTVTVLLNNLGSVGHRLAEIRNQFGTGHGRPTHHVGLQRRHAKLAVGVAATLAAFLFECHEDDTPGSRS